MTGELYLGGVKICDDTGTKSKYNTPASVHVVTIHMLYAFPFHNFYFFIFFIFIWLDDPHPT